MNIKTFLLTQALVAVLPIQAQYAIIYRDGRVKRVKIVQTNNDKTLYTEWGNKHAAEEYVENTAVFMLKFKSRGNVVFDSRGERILTTSASVKIPKDAIVIYFKDGREVPVYNLTMDERTVSYRLEKKAKSRQMFSAKSEVFMICYPDGTRDILTDLITEERLEREFAEHEARRKAEEQIAREDSIRHAEEQEKALAAAPKHAVIVTKKGSRMKVWICADENGVVSYKKENTSKAPLFRMSKSRIKSIQY